MKVMVLEDDAVLRSYIEKYLNLKGVEVRGFASGDAMLEEDGLAEADCIVLDINLPGINGFEVMEYLRDREIDTPVIFISALKEVEEVARAFSLGGSDYMKKPFDLAELELRIRHRSRQSLRQERQTLCRGCEYDLAERKLFRDGEEVHLSPLPGRLLYHLVRNAGRLLTFETLIERVWQGKEVGNATVSSHIKELRKTVPCISIRNIRGEGYSLSLESSACS